MKRRVLVTAAAAVLLGVLPAISATANAGFTLTSAANPGGTSGSEIFSASSAGVGGAWAVGRTDASSGNGEVWRSTPTTASWHTVAVPVTGAIYDVSSWGSTAWTVSQRYGTGKVAVWEWTGNAWANRSSASWTTAFHATGIVVAGPSSVWIVGNTNAQPAAAHWNGTTWLVTHPVLFGGAGQSVFSKVAFVPGSSDVIAVGIRNSLGRGNGKPFEELWTGTKWTVMRTAAVAGGVDASGGVAAVSPTSAWYVLTMATTKGAVPLILHWNGGQWSPQTSPPIGTNGSGLVAVDASSPSNAWAVGSYSLGVGLSSPLVEHWNGVAWSVAASQAKGTNSWLTGVTTVPGSACRVLVVGASLQGSYDVPFGERNC